MGLDSPEGRTRQVVAFSCSMLIHLLNISGKPILSITKSRNLTLALS